MSTSIENDREPSQIVCNSGPPPSPGTMIQFEYRDGQWQDAEVTSHGPAFESGSCTFQVKFFSAMGRVATQSLHHPKPNHDAPKRWRIMSEPHSLIQPDAMLLYNYGPSDSGDATTGKLRDAEQKQQDDSIIQEQAFVDHQASRRQTGVEKNNTIDLHAASGLPSWSQLVHDVEEAKTLDSQLDTKPKTNERAAEGITAEEQAVMQAASQQALKKYRNECGVKNQRESGKRLVDLLGRLTREQTLAVAAQANTEKWSQESRRCAIELEKHKARCPSCASFCCCC